ncbi:DinB family protein [Nocardia sp. NPDC052316]|uniref:DinB family protein n=1 Tax=Nocardia sp. NPDC052316 TaxID=3364329 RepID=UPI0037C5BD80
MADQEREELISILANQRELFRITVRGIDDEQARRRTTASELTLGGLLHHLISCERHWITVLTERDENAQLDVSRFEGEYLMAEGETVEGLLAEWDEAAAATAELIRTVDSLDTSVPTPTAPWSPEREWWTVRYTLLHILREISHHSGHADIIREELDGANTTYSRIA